VKDAFKRCVVKELLIHRYVNHPGMQRNENDRVLAYRKVAYPRRKT